MVNERLTDAEVQHRRWVDSLLKGDKLPMTVPSPTNDENGLKVRVKKPALYHIRFRARLLACGRQGLESRVKYRDS